MAVFYAGNGRETEAEQYLRNIATITPTVSARLALADYYIALNLPPTPCRYSRRPQRTATDTARRGAGSRPSSIAGRTAEAHKTIDETLATDPSQPRALLTKGQFLLVEKKIDDAIKLLKAAVRRTRDQSRRDRPWARSTPRATSTTKRRRNSLRS